MGTAWMMYTQDYDERFPTSQPLNVWGDCATMKDRGSYGGWVGNLLVPYSKNTDIFKCPSVPKATVVNYGSGCAGPSNVDEAYAKTKWGIPYIYISYSYNYVA